MAKNIRYQKINYSTKNLAVWNDSIYFVFQSTFMNSKNQHLNTLQDIKQMMERSSRFISLSGLSGIAAGSCALVGAWFAHDVLRNSNFYIDAADGNTFNGKDARYLFDNGILNPTLKYNALQEQLFYIAGLTFVAAFTLSFLFTYLRSKKTNTPIWGTTAKRLLINVSIPMIVGGIFLLKLLPHGSTTFTLIAPGCLIFYGLALVNASKYTLVEIKFLGYGQLLLGIINLWFVGKGLYFWAAGFGILHILYGIIMWYRYERNS